MRIAGAVAVVGGIGAAVAKKLKGGGTAEPLYTPPPAPEPMKPPAELADVPSPPKTSVNVGDLGGDNDGDAPSAPTPSDAADTGGDEPVADAGTESAVAASEQAAAAATPPPPAGTAPTVPDTDVDTAADTTGDDEVEDAMDAYFDSEAEAADADTDTEPIVTAAADPDELESAAAGDAHGDDAPTVPADSDKS